MRAGRHVLGTVAAVAAALGGCVTDTGQPPAMTDDALQLAIAGRSYVGTRADGSSVCIHHAADGRFLGRAGSLVSGSWAVEDGRLCYSYIQGPEEPECRQVVMAGNRAALLDEGTIAGQGHLAEGNVCA